VVAKEITVPEFKIDVPEELAGLARSLNIPITAVCQRALVDAVTSTGSLRGRDTLAGDPPSLTWRAVAVVEHARSASPEPTSADVVRALAAEGDFAREVLRALGADLDDLAAEVALGEQRGGVHADGLAGVVQRAISQAVALGHRHVGSEHLLLGLAMAPTAELVADTLLRIGLEPARIQSAVVFMLAGFNFARRSGGLAVRRRGPGTEVTRIEWRYLG
jgi:Clp amino terminal domain, pathogenicity island component